MDWSTGPASPKDAHRPPWIHPLAAPPFCTSAPRVDERRSPFLDRQHTWPFAGPPPTYINARIRNILQQRRKWKRKRLELLALARSLASILRMHIKNNAEYLKALDETNKFTIIINKKDSRLDLRRQRYANHSDEPLESSSNSSIDDGLLNLKTGRKSKKSSNIENIDLKDHCKSASLQAFFKEVHLHPFAPTEILRVEHENFEGKNRLQNPATKEMTVKGKNNRSDSNIHNSSVTEQLMKALRRTVNELNNSPDKHKIAAESSKITKSLSTLHARAVLKALTAAERKLTNIEIQRANAREAKKRGRTIATPKYTRKQRSTLHDGAFPIDDVRLEEEVYREVLGQSGARRASASSRPNAVERRREAAAARELARAKERERLDAEARAFSVARARAEATRRALAAMKARAQMRERARQRSQSHSRKAKAGEAKAGEAKASEAGASSQGDDAPPAPAPRSRGKGHEADRPPASAGHKRRSKAKRPASPGFTNNRSRTRNVHELCSGIMQGRGSRNMDEFSSGTMEGHGSSNMDELSSGTMEGHGSRNMDELSSGTMEGHGSRNMEDLSSRTMGRRDSRNMDEFSSGTMERHGSRNMEDLSSSIMEGHSSRNMDDFSSGTMERHGSRNMEDLSSRTMGGHGSRNMDELSSSIMEGHSSRNMDELSSRTMGGHGSRNLDELSSNIMEGHSSSNMEVPSSRNSDGHIYRNIEDLCYEILQGHKVTGNNESQSSKNMESHSSRNIVDVSSRNNEGQISRNMEDQFSRILEGLYSKNMEGHISRKIEGLGSRDMEGHNSRNTEGHIDRSLEGHTSRNIEGHSSMKNDGHCSRNMEGHNSRSMEGQSSRNIEGPRFRIMEGQISRNIGDQSSKDKEAHISRNMEGLGFMEGHGSRNMEGLGFMEGHGSRNREGHSSKNMEGNSFRSVESHIPRNKECLNPRNTEVHSPKNKERLSSTIMEGHSSRHVEGHSSQIIEGLKSSNTKDINTTNMEGPPDDSRNLGGRSSTNMDDPSPGKVLSEVKCSTVLDNKDTVVPDYEETVVSDNEDTEDVMKKIHENLQGYHPDPQTSRKTPRSTPTSSLVATLSPIMETPMPRNDSPRIKSRSTQSASLSHDAQTIVLSFGPLVSCPEYPATPEQFDLNHWRSTQKVLDASLSNRADTLQSSETINQPRLLIPPTNFNRGTLTLSAQSSPVNDFAPTAPLVERRIEARTPLQRTRSLTAELTIASPRQREKNTSPYETQQADTQRENQPAAFVSPERRKIPPGNDNLATQHPEHQERHLPRVEKNVESVSSHCQTMLKHAATVACQVPETNQNEQEIHLPQKVFPEFHSKNFQTNNVVDKEVQIYESQIENRKSNYVLAYNQESELALRKKCYLLDEGLQCNESELEESVPLSVDPLRQKDTQLRPHERGNRLYERGKATNRIFKETSTSTEDSHLLDSEKAFVLGKKDAVTYKELDADHRKISMRSFHICEDFPHVTSHIHVQNNFNHGKGLDKMPYDATKNMRSYYIDYDGRPIENRSHSSLYTVKERIKRTAETYEKRPNISLTEFTSTSPHATSSPSRLPVFYLKRSRKLGGSEMDRVTTQQENSSNYTTIHKPPNEEKHTKYFVEHMFQHINPILSMELESKTMSYPITQHKSESTENLNTWGSVGSNENGSANEDLQDIETSSCISLTLCRDKGDEVRCFKREEPEAEDIPKHQNLMNTSRQRERDDTPEEKSAFPNFSLIREKNLYGDKSRNPSQNDIQQINDEFEFRTNRIYAKTEQIKHFIQSHLRSDPYTSIERKASSPKHLNPTFESMKANGQYSSPSTTGFNSKYGKQCPPVGTSSSDLLKSSPPSSIPSSRRRRKNICRTTINKPCFYPKPTERYNSNIRTSKAHSKPARSMTTKIAQAIKIMSSGATNKSVHFGVPNRTSKTSLNTRF